MKIKHKTPVSNSQGVVRFSTKEDWKTLFSWLLKQNYRNVHNYTEDLPPKLPVVCVDKKDMTFFGVSVTCMAGRASKGCPTLDLQEFLSLNE